MLVKWFNHYAELLAKQLPKEYPTNDIDVIPWIIPKEILIDKISIGVFNWLQAMDDIKYITIREGMEANFLVFLTRDMKKFHETYLVEEV